MEQKRDTVLALAKSPSRDNFFILSNEGFEPFDAYRAVGRIDLKSAVNAHCAIAALYV